MRFCIPGPACNRRGWLWFCIVYIMGLRTAAGDMAARTYDATKYRTPKLHSMMLVCCTIYIILKRITWIVCTRLLRILTSCAHDLMHVIRRYILNRSFIFVQQYDMQPHRSYCVLRAAARNYNIVFCSIVEFNMISHSSKSRASHVVVCLYMFVLKHSRG